MYNVFIWIIPRAVTKFVVIRPENEGGRFTHDELLCNERIVMR